MQHGVGAIRTARPRTTFVMPVGARERRFGPVGLLRLSPGSTGGRDTARFAPLPAVRAAARSAGMARRTTAPVRLSGIFAVRAMRWSSSRPGLPRARRSGTGPWLA